MIRFYTKEISYRLFYVLFSFVVCTCISFWHIQSLLLLETYPFLEFSNKKFTVTHVTELIDVVWVLTLSTSFLFIFPLFFHQLIQFCRGGWYNYQIYFSKKMFNLSLFFYWTSLSLCYYFLLPIILVFLSQWEVKQIDSILKIEVEFKILSYITWILAARYCIGILNYLLVIFALQMSYLFHLLTIYKAFKLYRKQFFFATITILFILSSSEIFLQIYFICVIFALYESAFIFFCYKIFNTKTKI